MNMMKSRGMTRHTVPWPERAIIPTLVGTGMNCDAGGGRVAGMRRTCDVRRMGRCAVDVPPSRNAAVASHRGSLLIIFTNLNVARLQTKSLCRSARGAHGFETNKHSNSNISRRRARARAPPRQTNTCHNRLVGRRKAHEFAIREQDLDLSLPLRKRRALKRNGGQLCVKMHAGREQRRNHALHGA